MILDNLQLLASLYRRPARAMGRILDEGSLLFGALAVLLTGAVLAVSTFLPIWASLEKSVQDYAALGKAAGKRAEPRAGPEAARGGPAKLDDALEAAGRDRDPMAIWVDAFFGTLASSVLVTLAALALLYVPACLLVASLLAPVGSFGLVFRRDYGALLACTLFSWTAAQLPFALAALVLAGRSWPLHLGLLAAGLLAFAGLMVVAVRVVLGVSVGVAMAVTVLGSAGLVLAPLAPFAASPFVLYFAWQYLHGELADLQSIFGRRQSFKRHLQVATLNPRDAQAHYELGLIHKRRHEFAEAAERFKTAAQIDPTDVDSHYQLGRMAREEGHYEEAIRHFEEVVRRDEAHSRHEIWREIGATYVASTSWPNARWALEKYTTARPHDPEGLFLLGDALSGMGALPDAQDAYRRCIEAVDTMPPFRRSEVSRFRRQARKRLGG
jgi:Flp pilus assembly protein TadD